MLDHFTEKELHYQPAELINHEHTRQQVDIGSCWCEEHDYDFYLVTDIDLRTGHRLANIKLLWRYARLGVPYILIEHIRSLLHKEPHGLEFVHVVTKLKQQYAQFPSEAALYHLLFRHVLSTDLTLPLMPSSRLSWSVSD